ncbi:Protein SHK-1 f [Aphelenchoides avenae]|nr:Protein SHK-1 f [Aphelenchus avenae]
MWKDSEDPSDTSSYDFKPGEYRPLSNHHKKCNGDVNKIPEDHIVTINVSGTKFQTLESTLRRFPDSLLGNPKKRKRYWRETDQEYFFDRHRSSFEAILHIYQTGGQVVRPEAIPIALFIKELKFYEFGKETMENFWESEGYQKPEAVVMPKNHLQRKTWELMEQPDSSLFARVLAFISVSVIIISIVTFCMETMPEFKTDEANREWSSPFFWIEFFCCVWFSVELIVRFISCPCKVRFCKSFLNILDFVAVAPFFINLAWGSKDEANSSISFSVLRIVRLVRVFRIFKLSRHSVGLQVLGKTFRASVQEFCLLIFFMGIALVLFSSGVYFAEQGETNTNFTSIPASFWFVLATMTTVGYGDLVPTGTYGKIVGSCCALIGVLTLALPVPIIVANFKHFYRQECRLATMVAQNQLPQETEDDEGD